jgi:hypothetical protein
MSNSNSSKASLIARINSMIAGLQKNLTGQTLVLGGSSITVSDLIAKLTAVVAQLNATTAAKVAWQAQVQASNTLETTEFDPLWAALGHCLEGMYGPTSTALAEFGIKPRKPPERTVKSKAVSVERNLATRAARGTKGARQKASIHGTVPPAAPTPPSGEAPQVVKPADDTKK